MSAIGRGCSHRIWTVRAGWGIFTPENVVDLQLVPEYSACLLVKQSRVDVSYHQSGRSPAKTDEKAATREANKIICGSDEGEHFAQSRISEPVERCSIHRREQHGH